MDIICFQAINTFNVVDKRCVVWMTCNIHCNKEKMPISNLFNFDRFAPFKLVKNFVKNSDNTHPLLLCVLGLKSIKISVHNILLYYSNNILFPTWLQPVTSWLAFLNCPDFEIESGNRFWLEQSQVRVKLLSCFDASKTLNLTKRSLSFPTIIFSKTLYLIERSLFDPVWQMP